MTDKVWVASFPRAGNTLCRIILAQCFGQDTSSVYGTEFGRLTQYSKIRDAVRERHSARFIKTHAKPGGDDWDAIVVCRHPATLMRANADFGNADLSMCKWPVFYDSWLSSERKLLVLRYEDMVENLECTLSQIHQFTGLPVLSRSIPPRAQMADGSMIRPTMREIGKLTDQESAMLLEYSGLLRRLGYA